MRIENFLTVSAGRIGSEAAVVAGGRAYSYARLAQSAERIAVALADGGVKHGDRVGVLMDTTAAAVAVTFGIMMAGAVVCVVDKSLDGDGLAAFVVEHRPAALAVDARYATLAAGLLADPVNDVGVVLLNGPGAARAGTRCVSISDLLVRLGAPRSLPAAGTSDDAALVLASLDARAEVKRPMTLSHGELAAGAECTAPRHGFVLRSIFTFAGFCHLAEAIRTGVTVVLDAPFEPLRRSVRVPVHGPGAAIPEAL
jgi:acyl-CoA synthetase (AMP-forming)/AMP-acid ligase II